jgi:ATP-dependent helicase/nuclease subunit A
MRVPRRVHVSDDLQVRAMTVGLTDEQALAVARRSESLLLSAAAGSGKTSVLVERFVAAVREDGIAPARILAITFTERAAGELRARVRARLLELGDREAARDTEAAFVGTFHGFCARLLRTHALAAGLDPGFAVVEEGLAGRLRELAFASALRDFLADGRSDAVDLMAAYGVDRVRTMIEQVHAELRSRGQRLPRLPPAREAERPLVADDDDEVDAASDADAARACILLDELLQRFGVAYEQVKRARGSVDFDDLELLAGELLAQREGVRAAWSERFELLMVDEFQDTNRRQLSILAALDRGNLFTVGDELQSIYGFRHAEVSLFRERRSELERAGGSLRLARNFRSREPLLDVVNAVFAGRFVDYTPLAAGRSDGPSADGGREAELGPEVELLLTDARGWEEREDLAEAIAAGLPHAQLWRQAEARLLAQRVAELVSCGASRAGDVVVLLRAVGDLEVFERALQLRGLRTLAAVGAFWGHQQIGDLLAYLRALANPLDERALYGALASPLGGCSRDCLALIANAARAHRRGVWETALEMIGEGEADPAVELSSADRDALASFCTWLQSERDAAPRRTISALIERAIDGRGYREHVLSLDWAERRLANVHKLLRVARRFEASEGRDLRAFLDHVGYLEQAARVEPDAPVEGVEPDAVRLMTIHAAKGLEFPVVCVADLGRQPNTQTPDLLVDGERVGLRLVRLDGAGSSATLDHEDLCRERRAREAEEEDRILYVAMTRARERLLLSGAVAFERWPSPELASTAISWLAPALSAELPALAMAGDAAVLDLPIEGGRGAVSVRCRLNTPATVGSVLALDAPVVAVDRNPERVGETAGVAGETAGVAGETAGVAGGQLSIFAECPPSPAPTAADVPADVSVDAIAIGAREVEHPALVTPLSYTSLTELERCGYRYYLERVLGLPEDRAAARATPERKGGLEARARGTLIHRLMESLDFGSPRGLSSEDVAEVAGELGMKVGEQERAEIARLIAAASAAEPAARVAAARTVRREHPFAFALGEGAPLITGVIDLLASEADGGCLVVDYKSDRVGAEVDLETLVRREYPVQRLLYALAVLRGGAPSVEIVHWFLERPGEWASVRHTSLARGELERQLASRVARARAGSFAVSPRPHRGLCLTCPGRVGLCSWGESETLREDQQAELSDGAQLVSDP